MKATIARIKCNPTVNEDLKNRAWIVRCTKRIRFLVR